jgi:tryptophan-rich sensory protein
MTSTTLHSPPASATWSTGKTWLGVASIVLAVSAVAVVGALVTAPAVRTWYPNLPRPAWTPPDWIFGPVWTVLYAMMAVAASIVWAERDRTDVCCPLGAFAVQLALNLAWPLLFFGLKSPLLAFLDICLLWVAAAVTATQFWLVSRAAAWLFVPYWAWVTFAAALNAAIVLLGA